MTTKDLEKFFKRANKVIDNYEGKLSVLDYDYFIISSIIFTSDEEYYYLFSVFKDNKVIEKIPIFDASEYSKTFKDLSIKYKTNVIYNYKDLNYTQIDYLDNIEDNCINRDEINSIKWDMEMNPFN